MVTLAVPVQASESPKVVLAEDEFILPPYLAEVLGAPLLNIVLPLGHKRSAAPQEWLERGDAFSLPAHLAFQVWMNEGFQWVAGGVFQGKVLDLGLVESGLTDEVHFEHGWMKIWMNPLKTKGKRFRLKVRDRSFLVENAEFWMGATESAMEVYMIKGKITDLDGKVLLSSSQYAKWETNKGEPTLISQAWNEKPLEVRLAALYPHFVKLAGRADLDWEKGRVTQKYAELRKKGWRKSSRFHVEKRD